MEESNRKKSIYKNVLTFPKDTDHLKYFEKNPHPDKIPDELLTISEALNQHDLNVNYFQKKREFDSVRKFLEPNLSDEDKLLLRFPEKLQEIINSLKDPDWKLAYTYLRDCFLTFFSTPLDKNIKPDIQWIIIILQLDFHQPKTYWLI